MIKIRGCLIFAIILVIFIIGPIYGEIPHLINYQGRLTISGVVQTGTQIVTMTFKIWDAESGGNERWEETQTVSVINGIFNVLLGSVKPIEAGAFQGEHAWLETLIGSTSLGRQRIVSVGYSYMAEKAESATTAATAVTANTLVGKTPSQFIDTSDTAQTKVGSLTINSNLTVGGTINGIRMVSGYVWEDEEPVTHHSRFIINLDSLGIPGKIKGVSVSIEMWRRNRGDFLWGSRAEVSEVLERQVIGYLYSRDGSEELWGGWEYAQRVYYVITVE